jgi:hypothetical protein
MATVTVSVDVRWTSRRNDLADLTARASAERKGAEELNTTEIEIPIKFISQLPAASQEGAPANGAMITYTYEVTGADPISEDHPMNRYDTGIVYSEEDTGFGGQEVYEPEGINVAEKVGVEWMAGAGDDLVEAALATADDRINMLADGAGISRARLEERQVRGPMRLGGLSCRT